MYIGWISPLDRVPPWGYSFCSNRGSFRITGRGRWIDLCIMAIKVHSQITKELDSGPFEINAYLWVTSPLQQPSFAIQRRNADRGIVFAAIGQDRKICWVG
jgi:hypothetical protein